MGQHPRVPGTLRAELSALPGVGRTLVDEETGNVWLAYEPGADIAAVERGAQDALRQHGFEPDGVGLLLVPLNSDALRRVRFVGVETRPEAEGRISVAVTLEWRGERAAGRVEGERGALLEIRTAAGATLRALELLEATQPGIQLIGAKPLRAFDEDILVVSLALPTHRRLVGAVLVGGEPLRAVALAVLDALNRVLGRNPTDRERV